jgi:aspartate/methionine/tyrosine aminotransferase
MNTIQNIQPFKLERYFAEYEFKVRHLLSPSDCESLAMSELLALASPASRARWDELRLGYTEAQGHPELRQEIARLYPNLSAEQVLLVTPEEGIFIFMHAYLRPGDEVIAVSPAYQSLLEIARSLGCRVREWRVQPGAGGWRLDLDWLAQALSDQTRLLVVNFPHNPTGYLPAQDEWQEILNLARQHGVAIFSDEMYRGLEYQPEDRLPSAADHYERAITLSGLSKTYALPGLRVGWLALQDRALLEKLWGIKDYTTICASAPAEILGLIALENGPALIERSLGIVRQNLRAAEAFFAGRPEQFEWLAPRAGSVAFPRWKGGGRVEQFCQTALEQAGVMIAPGSLFDYPGDHFRVGLGRTNFNKALEQLGLSAATLSGVSRIYS